MNLHTVHGTTQNSTNNIPSYPPGNHHVHLLSIGGKVFQSNLHFQ